MTYAELAVLFERLLSLPAGTEIVEFKQPSRSFDFEQFGQYFSALSNEANLRGHGAAWLVLGVNEEKEQGFNLRPDSTSLTAFKEEVAAKVGSGLKIRQIYTMLKRVGVIFLMSPPASIFRAFTKSSCASSRATVGPLTHLVASGLRCSSSS